jgi:hypothetical protein
MLTYHSQSPRGMFSYEDRLAADLVLTTCDTLASDFQEIAGSDDQAIKAPSAKKQKLVNSLWEITWWCITLNEAYVIRTVTTP